MKAGLFELKNDVIKQLMRYFWSFNTFLDFFLIIIVFFKQKDQRLSDFVTHLFCQEIYN